MPPWSPDVEYCGITWYRSHRCVRASKFFKTIPFSFIASLLLTGVLTLD
jgi:hypothetical protein